MPLAQNWQFENYSIEKLIEQADTTIPELNEKLVVLKGDDARSVYGYLGESLGIRIFVEEMQDGTKKYYALSARPLLPYEIPGDDNDLSQIPAPGSPKPNFKLTCYPSDGILSIPANP
jgi:hypothetical protein